MCLSFDDILSREVGQRLSKPKVFGKNVKPLSPGN
jgi:hypothetical protein